jgi:hypothetical protein
MSWPRRDHGRAVVAGQLRITGVQIRIVKMALDHTLFEAVRHGYVRHAAVVGEHPPMRGQPVAALHVLGRPGKEQLAKTQTGDKDPGFADLPGREVDPRDRVPGIVHLDAFTGLERARRDGRLPVLRELAVELFPEVAVGG